MPWPFKQITRMVWYKRRRFSELLYQKRFSNKNVEITVNVRKRAHERPGAIVNFLWARKSIFADKRGRDRRRSNMIRNYWPRNAPPRPFLSVAVHHSSFQKILLPITLASGLGRSRFHLLALCTVPSAQSLTSRPCRNESLLLGDAQDDIFCTEMWFCV